MFGAMIGLPEILIILLALFFYVTTVVGLILLVLWLVRRQSQPVPGASMMNSETVEFTSQARRFSFVELKADRARLRWDRYGLGLGVTVVCVSLLNGLLLAAGVWRGLDTVLVGLVMAVAAFNIFVLLEFHKAGSAAACPRCGTLLPSSSPQGMCPRCLMGVGIGTQASTAGEFRPQENKISPPPESEVARRFPHLEILECLGYGGMGVVFYEMLTGELPLGKFQPPSKKVEVDVRLDEVVLRALEKEPERRYQQARQVKTDVETIAHAPQSVPGAS